MEYKLVGMIEAGLAGLLQMHEFVQEMVGGGLVYLECEEENSQAVPRN